MDFRALTYGIIQEPSYSTQNPGNNFLQMPRYLGDLELRPDLRFDLNPLELMAKPRMRLEYSAWTGAGMREHEIEVGMTTGMSMSGWPV